MYGSARAADLDAWVATHEQLLQAAANAVPYLVPPAASADQSHKLLPTASSSGSSSLPYAHAATLIGALVRHTAVLQQAIVAPLREDLRHMSQDIQTIATANAHVHGARGPAMMEISNAPDDVDHDRSLWPVGVSFKTCVEGQARPDRSPTWSRRVATAMAPFGTSATAVSDDSDIDDGTADLVAQYMSRRKELAARRAHPLGMVHPFLRRLMRMTPGEMQLRREELLAEQAASINEDRGGTAGLNAADTALGPRGAAIEAEDEKVARRDGPGIPIRMSPSIPGTPASSTYGDTSASSRNSAAASRPTSAMFQSLKEGGGGNLLDAVRRITAPFPFAYELVPAATLLRKLLRTLEEGTCSTVVHLDFTSLSIGRVLNEEAQAPMAMLTAFAKALTLDGLRAIVVVREVAPPGASAASWRNAAERRQFQRHMRGSAVLATRGAAVLRERLRFAVDRPVGLLAVLAPEMASVVQCAHSSCVGTLPAGGPPFTLVYPTAGQHPVYFSTQNAPDSFVTINVSPWLLCPTSYALCSVHPMHVGSSPHNWVLEGSNDDGQSYMVLREHVNDESFLKGSDFVIFDIPPVTYTHPVTKDMCTRRFSGSMFRLRSTGRSALGTLNLQVAAVEFYGRAMGCTALPPLAEMSRPTPAAVFGDSIATTLTCGVPAGRGSVLSGKKRKGLRPLPLPDK